MYKCVVLLCMISSATCLVASNEINRKNKGKQRKVTEPLAIPQIENSQFIELQSSPRLQLPNNPLIFYTYGKLSSAENSPRGSARNSPRDEWSY
jgi:hypothetical protein